MDPEITKLIAEIHAHCEAARLAGRRLQVSTFCRAALNDGSFVARLEAGGQCLPRTMARVRQYMADNPPQRRDAA